jgi:hypothetical protein
MLISSALLQEPFDAWHFQRIEYFKTLAFQTTSGQFTLQGFLLGLVCTGTLLGDFVRVLATQEGYLPFVISAAIEIEEQPFCSSNGSRYQLS